MHCLAQAVARFSRLGAVSPREVRKQDGTCVVVEVRQQHPARRLSLSRAV
tara:strand:- start:43 stop:192 length:150 start_codon:yes stop_codon:yes gene_type:complete